METKKKKVVILGGGVGSSTFTKALITEPVELTTIVSTFDDGGSTGAIRRDYGGIALGDFRQCFFGSIELDPSLVQALNHRFGKGSLFGMNAGNLFIRAFLDEYPNEREGVERLHQLFGLKNRILPVSYDFAQLCAKLGNGRSLSDQQQIADYLSFSAAPIKDISLSARAKINPDAKRAIIAADYLVFAPGHFFTSVLPHLYVEGFAEAWKKSKAKKIWFVNLLAHRGQDSFYSLRDYLRWFERKLGPRPFDLVVINKNISKKVLRSVSHRFSATNVTESDLRYLASKKVSVAVADLVSHELRAQQANDTIMRAPLRHDRQKIRTFFIALLDA